MDRRVRGDREGQRRDIDREVRRAVDVRARFVRELDDFDRSLETLRRPRWHVPPDDQPGETVPVPRDDGGTGA